MQVADTTIWQDCKHLETFAENWNNLIIQEIMFLSFIKPCELLAPLVCCSALEYKLVIGLPY